VKFLVRAGPAVEDHLTQIGENQCFPGLSRLAGQVPSRIPLRILFGCVVEVIGPAFGPAQLYPGVGGFPVSPAGRPLEGASGNEVVTIRQGDLCSADKSRIVKGRA
jgi:hypothetical protein